MVNYSHNLLRSQTPSLTRLTIMQTITKYRTNDGTEFETPDKAVEHERLCDAVDRAMSRLAPRPKTTDFTNGEGYVQHEEETVLVAMQNVLSVISSRVTHSWIEKAIEDPRGFESHVGRLLDDCGLRYVCSAWHRFLCTDNQWREWGQPYYRMNPQDGTAQRLN